MGFADIIGHSRQLAPLRAALGSRRLHHAYLFVGPEGVGKHTIAMVLAQAVHCVERNDDGCGRCAQCERIINGNHPDVRMVGRLEGKKEITIQQVREIERELRYRSFEGERKIAVVDPAGAMNPAAQNALLKTLEEPPENSLIILITPNGGELLPTLRSRCLRLSFAPLSRTQIAEFLKRNGGVSDRDVDVIAAMGMGSIGRAVGLKNGEWMDKRRSWGAVLGQLSGGDYQAAMAEAEALATDREETLEFFRWVDSWFRDLLVYTVTRGQERIVNLDMLAEIEQQVRGVGGTRALRALEEIAAASAAIQRNLNRRMVLEKFFFTVMEAR